MKPLQANNKSIYVVAFPPETGPHHQLKHNLKNESNENVGTVMAAHISIVQIQFIPEDLVNQEPKK